MIYYNSVLFPLELLCQLLTPILGRQFLRARVVVIYEALCTLQGVLYLDYLVTDLGLTRKQASLFMDSLESTPSMPVNTESAYPMSDNQGSSDDDDEDAVLGELASDGEESDDVGLEMDDDESESEDQKRRRERIARKYSSELESILMSVDPDSDI